MAALIIPFAKADEWNKRMVLTTHQVIRIQGRILEPGQHVMKLFDSQSHRLILQVYDSQETQLEMTILASSAYRLHPAERTLLTFYDEVPNDNGPALHTWFYPGDKWGLEFAPR